MDLTTGAGVGLGIGLSGQPNTYAPYYAARQASEAKKQADKIAAKAKGISDLESKIGGIKISNIDPFYEPIVRGKFDNAIRESQLAFAEDPNNGLMKAQNILSAFSADLNEYQGKSKLVAGIRDDIMKQAPQGLYKDQEVLLKALNSGDRELLKNMQQSIFGVAGYNPDTDLPMHAAIGKDVDVDKGLAALVSNKDFADARDKYRTVVSDGRGGYKQVQYAAYSPARRDELLKGFISDKGVYANIGRELENKGLLNPSMPQEQIDLAILNEAKRRMPSPKFIVDEYSVHAPPKDTSGSGSGDDDDFSLVLTTNEKVNIHSMYGGKFADASGRIVNSKGEPYKYTDKEVAVISVPVPKRLTIQSKKAGVSKSIEFTPNVIYNAATGVKELRSKEILSAIPIDISWLPVNERTGDLGIGQDVNEKMMHKDIKTIPMVTLYVPANGRFKAQTLRVPYSEAESALKARYQKIDWDKEVGDFQVIDYSRSNVGKPAEKIIFPKSKDNTKTGTWLKDYRKK